MMRAKARLPLRGMIAPASLKQREGIQQPAVDATPTPGHDCPGLIEAVRSPAGMTSPPVHSGA